MTGGTEGSFAYGETVTLICGADNFAYWTVNGKIVSYDKAFSYIVTADLVVEAVKSDQPVVKEPAVSIDSPIFDTVTDSSKILMYSVSMQSIRAMPRVTACSALSVQLRLMRRPPFRIILTTVRPPCIMETSKSTLIPA